MLSSEICKAAGVTYRQLDYWVREGIIKPSIEDASGSGNARKWSEDDVLLVKVVDALLTCNIPQNVVRDVLPKLSEGRFIMAHWEGATFVDTWDEVRDLVATGRPWTILDLDAISHADSQRRKRPGQPRL